MSEEDCVFCKIVNGKIPCSKVWEDKNFIAFADIKPVRRGHTLIVAKKHFDSLMDLNEEISQKYISAVKDVAKVLIKKYNADGFNIVINTGEAAGQVVKHVHFHIIPRKHGDKKRRIFL
ncbi:MAG: HIT family protein [Candidatus Pacearchaeota archaeon]